MLALLLLGLSACRSTPQAAAALPTVSAGDEAVPAAPASATPAAPSPTSPPPVLVAPTATDLPSFAPPATVPFATPTPPPTSTPLPTETPQPESQATAPSNVAATEVLSDTAAAEATATLPPTFTPPALPGTSANEHYWLRRPVGEGGVVWTDKYYPYGSTRGGQLRPHHGVEFNVSYNTEILAAASGTVRVAGSDASEVYGPHPNFYGNLVVVELDSSWNGQPVFNLYGHLNEVLVDVGQHVDAQQVIGLSGATGVADGPHMHFEVRVGSNAYENTRNPLLWLYPFPDRGTLAGRVVWPDGSLAAEAPVSLHRVDGPAPYYAATTYAGDSVNADEGWNENFAVDDVVAGYYEATVKVGSEKFTAETWIYPYRTSFVEIVLEQPAEE